MHLAAAIRASNFVLIPTRPSQLDVTQTSRRIELVQALGKSFGVVINAAPPRRVDQDARLVEEARAALREHGARLSKGQITSRHAVVYAMTEGDGVVEREPNGAAAQEYARLTASLLQELTREPA